MGNRKKIIFNTNRLNDIENKKVIKKWNVKDFLVIPNEYTVIIQTIDNHFIKIYENEDGIFINDNNTTEALDNTKINFIIFLLLLIAFVIFSPTFNNKNTYF